MGEVAVQSTSTAFRYRPAPGGLHNLWLPILHTPTNDVVVLLVPSVDAGTAQDGGRSLLGPPPRHSTAALPRGNYVDYT